jgi:hypothetical protein
MKISFSGIVARMICSVLGGMIIGTYVDLLDMPVEINIIAAITFGAIVAILPPSSGER